MVQEQIIPKSIPNNKKRHHFIITSKVENNNNINIKMAAPHPKLERYWERIKDPVVSYMDAFEILKNRCYQSKTPNEVNTLCDRLKKEGYFTVAEWIAERESTSLHLILRLLSAIENNTTSSDDEKVAEKEK